jgi:hypothetical protein
MRPMPTLRRGRAVGQAIGRAIHGAAGAERVVVIGTGGLSHWVGDERRRAFIRQPAGTRYAHEAEYPLVLPAAGPVNDAFDREFLESLRRGQAAEFADAWSDDRLEDAAGNGAQEIRNWLLVAGVSEDAPAEVLAYAPVPEWHTGSAVAAFGVGK